MFDTYQVRAVTEHVTRKVHEHRAPTDESVKLLREMEAQAKSEVVDSIHLKDNTFDAKLYISKELMSLQRRYTIRFKLNNEKFEVVKLFDELNFDAFDALSEIHKAMSDKISAIILDKSIGDLQRGGLKVSSHE